MAEITAVIDTGSANARRMTATKNREVNDNFVFTSDANLTHEPKFWVGIFNVADFEHRIERPWVHPQRMGQLIVVPACEPGQDYSKPFVIPDIVQMKVERPGSWEIGTRGADGRFLAQDAINPEDPKGNWKTVRDAGTGVSMNEGTNLYYYGCFWTTAPTKEELQPTEEELKFARTRLERTYNRLVQEANLLFLQGARGIEQIGHLHRKAANYFGIVSGWNETHVRKLACPNCGEPLIQSAAVCTKCPAVINWQKALDLGLRTVKQAVEAGIIEPQAEHMGRGKRKAQQA